MGNANQTWGMDLVLTGERLRKIRREHHMSQDALVDHLWMMDVQISKNSVSSWETGKKRPSVDHLIALRDLYGCTLDELVVSRQRSRDTDDRDQLVPLKSIINHKASICHCVCSPLSCNPVVYRLLGFCSICPLYSCCKSSSYCVYGV